MAVSWLPTESLLKEATMKLPIDTSAIAFLCALAPEPLVDFETKRPRADEHGSRCTWSSSWRWGTARPI